MCQILSVKKPLQLKTNTLLDKTTSNNQTLSSLIIRSLETCTEHPAVRPQHTHSPLTTPTEFKVFIMLIIVIEARLHIQHTRTHACTHTHTPHCPLHLQMCVGSQLSLSQTADTVLCSRCVGLVHTSHTNKGCQHTSCI